jgi:enhancing lycopene biosynthesis protein 2
VFNIKSVLKSFGLTRLGPEPTIYCTRGEHANHYTTDVIPETHATLCTKHRTKKKTTQKTIMMRNTNTRDELIVNRGFRSQSGQTK